MRLAILASHQGTVMQAVLDACRAGTIAGEVVLVISNNSQAGALARARAAGIPWQHLSSATHPDPAALDAAICAALQAAGADWVLLAGYMKKLGPATLSRFAGRLLNTHPALLPKFGGQGFYGRKVHEAVIAAGDSVSGASVHLVDGDYDTGPVLTQVQVPVLPTDDAASLEERVKLAERQLLIDTLAQLARGEPPPQGAAHG